MQFADAPLPNLPQFQLNRHNVRGRSQGFKVIQGMNFIEPGNVNSSGSATSLAVGQQIASKPRRFEPQRTGLATLSFEAYFKETVDESPLENHRVRRVRIVLYLEDGSVQVDECRTENSGMPQGSFVKRHMIPKDKDAVSAGHLGVDDLHIGESVVIYGRRFHIVDANDSTKAWLEQELGRPRKDGLPFPKGQYDEERKAFMAKQTSGNHRIRKNDMKIFAEATLGNTVDTSKRAGFMKYDREVLAFDALWDDRAALYGDLHKYRLHYYLQDDTIEVANVADSNSGRDTYPLLLKRGKLAKDSSKRTYYNWRDLRLGATIDLYNRPLLLVDADGHTREFYNEQGTPLAEPIEVEDDKDTKAAPTRYVPPPTGFGTDEDSLLSCSSSLIPSPPRRRRGEELLLRFTAELDTPFTEDIGRQFIITVYGADSTVSIREPPRPNSGFMGGTFLSRSKVRRDPGDHEAGVLGPSDFQGGIGQPIRINGHPFVLTGADDPTRNWLEMHL